MGKHGANGRHATGLRPSGPAYLPPVLYPYRTLGPCQQGRPEGRSISAQLRPEGPDDIPAQGKRSAALGEGEPKNHPERARQGRFDFTIIVHRIRFAPPDTAGCFALSGLHVYGPQNPGRRYACPGLVCWRPFGAQSNSATTQGRFLKNCRTSSPTLHVTTRHRRLRLYYGHERDLANPAAGSSTVCVR